MPESKEYYKALVAVQQSTIDKLLKPSIEILSVKGIILSMIGELTLYATKNGKNEKYKDSLDRLMQISDYLEKCNKVNDDNYQLRVLLNRSIWERDKLEDEVSTLKKQIDATNMALNAE